MSTIESCRPCSNGEHYDCNDLGWMADERKFTNCPCGKAGHPPKEYKS